MNHVYVHDGEITATCIALLTLGAAHAIVVLCVCLFVIVLPTAYYLLYNRVYPVIQFLIISYVLFATDLNLEMFYLRDMPLFACLPL